MNKSMLTLCPAILLTLSMSVSAGERVDETKAASADGFVRITVIRGDLDIEGWDRNEIRVRGELDDKTEEFIFEVTGDDAMIEVRLPRNLNGWSSNDASDLAVMVPAGSSVDVSVVSTDVDVRDLSGGLEISGVSGDLSIRNVRDRLDITSVSGDIDAMDVAGRVHLKSVSGDVDVANGGDDFQLQSVSGDVLARNVRGEFDLETVSGSIELIDGSFSGISGHTVSGDADIAAEMQSGATFEFDSVSGSVRVRFMNDPDARFDLETGSGSIRNRLTRDEPRTSKYVRDETLRFVKGEGQGEVIIGTRSGDIIVGRD